MLRRTGRVPDVSRTGGAPRTLTGPLSPAGSPFATPGLRGRTPPPFRPRGHPTGRARVVGSTGRRILPGPGIGGRVDVGLRAVPRSGHPARSRRGRPRRRSCDPAARRRHRRASACPAGAHSARTTGHPGAGPADVVCTRTSRPAGQLMPTSVWLLTWGFTGSPGTGPTSLAGSRSQPAAAAISEAHQAPHRASSASGEACPAAGAEHGAGRRRPRRPSGRKGEEGPSVASATSRAQPAAGTVARPTPPAPASGPPSPTGPRSAHRPRERLDATLSSVCRPG
jgi:hypothetical protein